MRVEGRSKMSASILPVERRVLVLGAPRESPSRAFLRWRAAAISAFSVPELEIAQIEEVPWRRIHGFARLRRARHAHTAFLSCSKLAQVSPSAAIASLM